MTLTRREFVSVSAVALVSGRWQRAGAQSGFAGSFRELRCGVGTFTSRGGTVGWLANGDGTLVVDSQFADTARVLVDGLGERGALPVDTLINSHHHGDHTAGNGVFREVAGRIVAHRRVPELQRAAKHLRPGSFVVLLKGYTSCRCRVTHASGPMFIPPFWRKREDSSANARAH